MRDEIQFQDNRVSTAKMKIDVKNRKKTLNDAKLQEVTNNTSCKTKLRSIEVSTENGASIWLTVIPVKRNVFFFWRNKPSGMQCESDIISLWNVYQHYVFVETRLICNTLYLVRKED